MLNFLIKQIFYIRFFLGNKIINYIPYSSWKFFSRSFADNKWEKDVWYYTKDYRQGYGKVLFTAKLDGLFEETIWPAMWLIYTENLYFEIDIELWGKDKYPRLVFTSFINKYKGKGFEDKGFNFKCSKFISKLQSEFHEYTISRGEKGIRFYIDGILAGVIPYNCNAEMTLAAGNVSIKEIIVIK